jgi:hypothetical protein
MSALRNVESENIPESKRFYTPTDVAQMLKVSVKTAQRMFRDEPGVIEINNPRVLRRTRPHVTLRIPALVFDRVVRKISRD